METYQDLEMKSNKENLYGWLLTYNPHTDIWLAATRDNYFDLFSNQKSENILKSNQLTTLIEIITKTNGDKDKIKELLNLRN